MEIFMHAIHGASGGVNGAGGVGAGGVRVVGTGGVLIRCVSGEFSTYVFKMLWWGALHVRCYDREFCMPDIVEGTPRTVSHVREMDNSEMLSYHVLPNASNDRDNLT